MTFRISNSKIVLLNKRTSPFRLALGMVFCFFLHQTVVNAQLFPRLGAQRAGISSMTFLKLDPSPRSSALGGANICLSGDGFSTYTNPAAMTDNKGFTFSVSNAFRMAGMNNLYFAAQLADKSRGVWGISVQSLNSEPIKKRTVFQPEGTGELFYVSSNAIGLTYARMLTEKFSFGLTIKYLNENIAEYSSHAAAADLAFLYKLDFKDFKFAAFVQNFGANSRFSGSYTAPNIGNTNVSINEYTIPTQFMLGIALTPLKSSMHSLMTAIQLNQPNDNSANLRLGLEYSFRKAFFVRGGYRFGISDNTYPAFGFGAKANVLHQSFVFDFSSEPTPYTGWIHSIGLSLSFVKRDKNVQDAN